MVGYMRDIYDEYVHLVRLAVEGQQKDVIALAKKNIIKVNKIRPDLADLLKGIINNYAEGTSTARGIFNQPVPIDVDSKLELLRKEYVTFDGDITWTENVQNELYAVIEERRFENELIKNGLSPTRSILFIGPPGVGKTLAARWLSYQLKRPLYTLDLAAVMSSFLGRTGNNIRSVINYAQKTSSVLLLDEFDAVAKKRNDDTEIGELKRLVNVLLQSIDEWPSTGLLIAATNHPELLDPAVWRRFERIVEFPNPSRIEIQFMINKLLEDIKSVELDQLVEVLSYIFEGSSYAEVQRQMNIIQRDSIIKSISIPSVIEDFIKRMCKNLDRNKKVGLAVKLGNIGISQRRVSEMTGLSRDTLRKYKNET